MKYKVGDRVRVRQDLEIERRDGDRFDYYILTKYKGKEKTISKVSSEVKTYQLENIPYWFREEMLEDAGPMASININTNDSCLEYTVPDKNSIDSVIEKVRQALEEALKPKGKYIPKKGEWFYYLSTFGSLSRARYDDDDCDKYLLNNILVFRTNEEAEDYKLFREQVAELRKPFIYEEYNYFFVYDCDTKKVLPGNFVSTQYGVIIFGYTLDEIKKAREILGDDRIKKYLLDIWE